MSSKLKEISKKAPKTPGVYFWLNKDNKVIYVGRANNLKQRLSQYWQRNLNSKSQEMITKAKHLKLLETKTILESIIVEAENIKKYWPLYNIKDRDNRSFIYIIIDKKAFPKIELIRERQLNKINKKNFTIFGPYQSYNLIHTALKLIRRIFPYSLCQNSPNKPCFDRQIGLCPGVCVDEITKTEYNNNIENIKLLLKGRKEKLIEKLKKNNPEKIKALNHIQEVSLLEREVNLSKIIFNRIEAYDISHWQGKNPYGAMVVLEHGKINKSLYRLFKIKNSRKANDEEALYEVLYRRFNHPEWKSPDLILIDGGKPQISYLHKKFKDQEFVGLSKYQKDQLIYSKNISSKKKLEINKIKPLLITLRDESHRFANYARKRNVISGH
jgi:excinuclease ABC subunit C